jgi:hypothetical protein
MEISHRASQILDSILAITSSVLVLLAMMAVSVFLSQPVMAQGLPSTVRGDIGLQAGTLPPPGIYIINLVYNYNFDTLRANDGGKIEGTGSNQTFYGLAFTYVSEKKILGGDYSASSSCPWSTFRSILQDRICHPGGALPTCTSNRSASDGTSNMPTMIRMYG